ncbi:gluconolactonase [Rhodococcus sp. SC4]|nr:gluconolactonase [Rhodococcus sp. SC4]
MSEVTGDVRTILSELSFLECPRWHGGRVWVADFYTHRVLSLAGDGSDVRVEAEVPNQPAGLGWLPDGRLLIASMRDKQLLRREVNGDLVVHADLSGKAGGNLNDMVVDGVGRAYVGNFGFDLASGAPLSPASILRVDPDGTVTEAADGLWFPNGSVITDDGVLIVGETFANRVTAFDISDDGELLNRRVWAAFGEAPTTRNLGEVLGQLKVAADGCCLDAEGALWIADALSGRVIRVREGGDIVGEIQADSGVFACMLGGDDGRTLYVCAAPDFDENARSAAREARLLAVQVDVPHAGLP